MDSLTSNSFKSHLKLRKCILFFCLALKLVMAVWDLGPPMKCAFHSLKLSLQLNECKLQVGHLFAQWWVIGWIFNRRRFSFNVFRQSQVFAQILKRLYTTIQSAQNGCLIAHWAVLKSKLELAKFADQPIKGSRKPLFCKVHWHTNNMVDIFT